MDRCPHCGRALRPDAEACSYCGSDFETGWNPDADYYGFELPSEDDPFPATEQSPPSRGIVWDSIIGIGCVVLAALFFLTALRSQGLEKPATLVMIVLLLLSFWFFLVKTRSSGWEAR